MLPKRWCRRRQARPGTSPSSRCSSFSCRLAPLSMKGCLPPRSWQTCLRPPSTPASTPQRMSSTVAHNVLSQQRTCTCRQHDYSVALHAQTPQDRRTFMISYEQLRTFQDYYCMNSYQIQFACRCMQAWRPIVSDVVQNPRPIVLDVVQSAQPIVLDVVQSAQPIVSDVVRSVADCF